MERNFLKFEKYGFTLIELLVVVAILGVLAAVGIVSYSGYLGSAKKNIPKSQHDSIVKFITTEFFKCSAGMQENIKTFNNSGEVLNKCIPDDYAGKGLTGDFDPEGEFSDHFAFYRGWKNAFDLNNKDGIQNGCNIVDGGSSPKIGMTGICWTRGNNRIGKWCGNESWGPGIVVVTNTGDVSSDCLKDDNSIDTKCEDPRYSKLDFRLVSCIEADW